MKIGYARVSSKEQNLARQLKQLQEAGCEQIFKEKLSGANTDNRPQLIAMLESLQPGDIVIVSDLTRITRSTQDLFKLVSSIKEKGADLQSLKDTWLNTSDNNPYSSFLLTVMAGVNQLERDLIKMRQREGIELAKKRGVYKGRPKKYSEKHKGLSHAIELYQNRDKNGMTVGEICDITKVGRTTLYKAVKEDK